MARNILGGAQSIPIPGSSPFAFARKETAIKPQTKIEYRNGRMFIDGKLASPAQIDAENNTNPNVPGNWLARPEDRAVTPEQQALEKVREEKSRREQFGRQNEMLSKQTDAFGVPLKMTPYEPNTPKIRTPTAYGNSSLRPYMPSNPQSMAGVNEYDVLNFAHPDIVKAAQYEFGHKVSEANKRDRKSWDVPKAQYNTNLNNVLQQMEIGKGLAMKDFNETLVDLSPEDVAERQIDFDNQWSGRERKAISDLGGAPSGVGRYFAGASPSDPGVNTTPQGDWRSLINLKRDNTGSIINPLGGYVGGSSNRVGRYDAQDKVSDAYEQQRLNAAFGPVDQSVLAPINERLAVMKQQLQVTANNYAASRGSNRSALMDKLRSGAISEADVAKIESQSDAEFKESQARAEHQLKGWYDSQVSEKTRAYNTRRLNDFDNSVAPPDLESVVYSPVYRADAERGRSTPSTRPPLWANNSRGAPQAPLRQIARGLTSRTGSVRQS